MALFEFLMILISIIIGLGVTEILSGVARMIRARDSVRTYWIHTALQAAIFLGLIQIWWESWGLRTLPEITFVQAFVLLLSPIFVFLIAFLLYPDPVPGSDLREYYYRQSPVLWGLVAVATAVGSYVKPIPFGWEILQPDNLSGFITIPLAIILAVSDRPKVHGILVTATFVILVLDTVLPKYLITG